MLRLPLYLVGGVVRDILLEKTVNDFDLVVEGDAIKLARSLASLHGGKMTAHSRFGTAKWFLPDGLISQTDPALDFISARSEKYKHPAALPTVRLGSIEDDIRRRDFTINALAIRLDDPYFGELRDDLGGAEDLEKGLVRVLHPRSFLDDPTRMYRAVRYEKRYSFNIADDTLALIPEARPLVEKLSPQRIRHELDLILDEPNAVSILARLDELSLLSVIHPALSDFHKAHLANVKSNHPLRQDRRARWLLWLMHLSEQDMQLLNKRLHFSADLLKILLSGSSLYANRTALNGLKPSQSVELLEGHALRAVEVLHKVLPDGEVREQLGKYLSEWRHVKSSTTGHDLKKLDIEPGPKYAEILRRLRAAWLDGEVKSEEEEKKMLQDLIKQP
jgi:tRNA nucleotidyltransferase (CCA-adding enzyme)